MAVVTAVYAYTISRSPSSRRSIVLALGAAAVEFIAGHRETILFALVVAGAVLAAVACLWLLVMGYRATRARGPMALAVLGTLLAATPYAAHALNGKVADLSKPVRWLESAVHVHVAEPGDSIRPLGQVTVEMLVLAAGVLLVAGAVCWLFVRGLRQWPRSKRPVFLLTFAVVLLALPFAVNRLATRFIDLGEYERVVDGEIHLTLTQWNKSDYSVLRAKPDTAVLQMANPDVTDETLTYLKGMSRLHNLDLSNTQISDDGLAALRGLPLKELRLAHTKLTDAGFQEHIVPIASLQMLDVRDTSVSKDAVDAWKKAVAGRKAVR